MFKPGTTVGGKLWGNRNAHPSQWSAPFRGTVLAHDEPMAWAYSFEFPTDRPSSAEVKNLVIRYAKEGVLASRVPVLWDLDTHKVVRWERIDKIRLASEDLALWRAEKSLRLEQIAHPRKKEQKTLADFLPENMQHLAESAHE